MDQKKLSRWLKAVVLGVALCGAVVYVWILPAWGRGIAARNPEFAYCLWPWLLFLWGSALPCVWALVEAWAIFTRIGCDDSFCVQNARALKRVSFLAFADTAYFFAGQLVFLLLGMNHPGIFLLSLMIVFAGIAVTIVAAALSHLVFRAAQMREENDLTI
jgi:hypothetical protein